MENFKEFPEPPSFLKLLGPSFIILALGLGSGEVILWPFLVSNYGLGIVWGAILGITFQFFLNMEIERYALVKGESVFVGLAKLFRFAPLWFIISSFLGFGLPGIIAASAQIFSRLVGITEFKYVAIILLILIGFILSFGKTVYGMMEKITKIIILLGVPFVFILALFLADKTGWVELGQGILGEGRGFWFFPTGLSLATFLAAFVYSGAGGNLNLTQSIYIKEKGYGMGKYAQKISGLFHKNNSETAEIKLSGENFELNEQNISRFRKWWKMINAEHFIVFWFLGCVSMLMLMLLAFSTVYGLPGNEKGINFVISEGLVIGNILGEFFGFVFLLVLGIMLFQTQLGVMDSISRIMSENFALSKMKGSFSTKINLGKIYFIFVWLQIIFGIILFLFNIYEPKFLITLGAVINAFAMLVHVGLVSFLNIKTLPAPFQASWWRKSILVVIFLVFLFFCGVILWDNVLKNLFF